MIFSLFFFNDTATTEIYTLSLHDALPILATVVLDKTGTLTAGHPQVVRLAALDGSDGLDAPPGARPADGRSEEHTSELQSHLNLVCRLLLEKKKHKCRVTRRSQVHIETLT